MRRFRKLSLVFVLGSCSGCALTTGSVTRVVDGVEREGRAVSAEAYANYARGAVLENHGDVKGALRSYRAALAQDPSSAELLARVAQAECSLSNSADDAQAQSAEKHFAQAFELDPTSSTAWALAARCRAHRARPHEALEAARKAAGFDPDSVYLSLLVAEYAEALGDLRTARVWLDGLVVYAPTSREALRALDSFARRHDDRARRVRAERGLLELGVHPKPEVDLRTALERRDLAGMRKAAVALRLSAAELALRAVKESSAEVAAQQAELALNADPNDSNAWIAALCAADLAGDRKSVERLLSEAPVSPSPANPLALELLGELLARLAGDDGARAFNAVTEKDH
jgi:tetratricopeptide (TPR) repeat protein